MWMEVVSTQLTHWSLVCLTTTMEIWRVHSTSELNREIEREIHVVVLSITKKHLNIICYLNFKSLRTGCTLSLSLLMYDVHVWTSLRRSSGCDTMRVVYVLSLLLPMLLQIRAHLALAAAINCQDHVAVAVFSPCRRNLWTWTFFSLKIVLRTMWNVFLLLRLWWSLVWLCMRSLCSGIPTEWR